ncbi:MAG: hypothetical protein IAE79_15860 [Anaerolinea sp.]|nr:hypothetical protein [Anaerolinea sp.]
MSMKTHLERMCMIVDEVLAGHGLSAQVAGGYVARNGILFSLTDTTFVNTQVRLALKDALQAPRVLATVGVVLVNDWRQRQEGQGPVLEGMYEVMEPSSAADVETVDVLDLILAYEEERVTEKRKTRLLGENLVSRAVMDLIEPTAQQGAEAADDQEQRPDVSPFQIK